jgi:ubiquinol-cytochrome c reductase cytochrome b subunit
MVFAAVMLLAIVLLAWFFGPPELGNPPDPSLIEANPRPDWYLMWYFGILALLPHDIEDIFMIFAPVLAGGLLIAVPFISNRGERSPSRRPWAVAAVIMIAVMIGAFWRAGVQASWSPNFEAGPLPAQVVGANSGPVYDGAKLFEMRGCINCHLIQGYGGRRGPDLTQIGDKLQPNQMILRISNGATNMPAYASSLTPAEMDELVAFLQSRKSDWKPPQ